MKEIRCRICDSALPVAGTPPGPVSGEMRPGGPEVELEKDANGHYFMCPYCSARNVTVVTTSRSGRPTVQVAWAVMKSE